MKRRGPSTLRRSHFPRHRRTAGRHRVECLRCVDCRRAELGAQHSHRPAANPGGFDRGARRQTGAPSRALRRDHRRLQRRVSRRSIQAAGDRRAGDRRRVPGEIKLGTAHRNGAVLCLSRHLRHLFHLWRREDEPSSRGHRLRRPSHRRALRRGRGRGAVLPDLYRRDFGDARRRVRQDRGEQAAALAHADRAPERAPSSFSFS